MTQPWDYWHVAGGGGLTVYNTRELVESAGIIGPGGPVNYALHMLSARPFFVGDEGITVTAVSVNLDSSTTPGTCRFGIYACPPPSAHDMFPAQLLADFGELTLTGSFRPSLAVTPLALDPGFYYLATIFNNTSPTLLTAGYGQAQLGGPGFPLGYSPANGVGFIGFSVYRPYGALPSTFPALVAGSFGFVPAGVPPFGNNIQIYVECEAAITGTFQVNWSHNAAQPAGTATVTAETGTSVTIQYGSNTSPATFATALQTQSANVKTAISVGSTANFPNSGSSVIVLQNAGPLQKYAANVGQYLPITAIAVQI
jgi:hypothetical protein